jgi:hypothetical protein
MAAFASGKLLAQTEACCLWKFGVSIDAVECDARAYHLTQTGNINGEFPWAYIPPAKT